MKIYISGAISGIPQFKDIFELAEQKVRELFPEAEIVNPCKIHDNCDHAAYNWGEFMLCDIKALFSCTHIYMMSNWKSSKGAQIEHFISLTKDLIIIYE